MKTTISIDLPDEVATRLHRVAGDAGWPQSFVVQRALEFYFQERADVEIALDRLGDTTDRVISARKIRRALGLSG
jgi:predicted DNA-binding protein